MILAYLHLAKYHTVGKRPIFLGDALKRRFVRFSNNSVQRAGTISCLDLALERRQGFVTLENVVVTPDGFIWKDRHVVTGGVDYYNEKERIAPVPAETRAEGVYAASPVCTTNYYHWLVDVLPNFFQARNLGFAEPFFTIGPLAGYQKQIAALLHCGVEVLTKPTLFKKLVFSLHWDAGRPPAWAAKALLDKINTYIPAAGTPPSRYLILDRKNSYRNIVNIDSLVQALRPLPFEVLDPSELSFEDEVNTFRNARIIIGAHGAGFTNMLFMQPGTHCIECGYLRDREWQYHFKYMAELASPTHHWLDIAHSRLPRAHMMVDAATLRKKVMALEAVPHAGT